MSIVGAPNLPVDRTEAYRTFYRLNANFSFKRELYCVKTLTVFPNFNIKNLILMGFSNGLIFQIKLSNF
jgi:hypothetical protein